jgi:hypothetical protein
MNHWFLKLRLELPALFLGAAVALLIPGGASGQYFGGTLRVVNNSPEPLNVTVDGRLLGVAGPQRTSLFGNVGTGYKSITLATFQGQVRSVGRFFLPFGGTTTWTVGGVVYAPAPPAHPPGDYHPPHEHPHRHPHAVSTHHHHDHRHPHPTGLYHHHPYTTATVYGGTVQVFNRFPVPARIFIGSRGYGVVWPARSAIYYNVPAGIRTLRAVHHSLPDQVLAEQNVNVVAGSRAYVNLVPQFGVIRLVNSRAEPVEVSIDNAPPILLQPSQSFDVPSVLPGTRTLLARVAGQEIQTAQVPIYPGQVYTWSIRPSVGTIRVVSRSPEPLNLILDGAPMGPLAPMQERYLTDLQAGGHKLVATDASGQPRNTADMTVGAGETRMWVIEPAGPPHEPHPHPHPHPHASSPHHHHDHPHPHAPAGDHHHPY